MENLEFALITVFIIVVLLTVLTATIQVIGANMYDIVQSIHRHRANKHPFSKALRWRPLVSVVIPAFNEAEVIERCLKSICMSKYKKLEIIVVDDRSSDDTYRIVKKFAKLKTTRNLRVYKNPKNMGRGGAINTGVKKSKGELVMALDADSTVTPDSISRAVWHFAIHDVTALAPNVRIFKHKSLLGLLQRFEFMSSFRTKKFNTVTNTEHIIGGSGAVYRRDILEKTQLFDTCMLTEDIAMSLRIAHLGNKEFKLYYASDVAVFTEPVADLRGLFRQRYRWKLGSLQALFKYRDIIFSGEDRHGKLLSWYRLPMVVWTELLLLLEPIMMSYFLYLAITNQNYWLYFVSSLTLSAILLLAIWGDEHIRWPERLQMTLLVPIMYPLYYVLSIIQVIAMFVAMRNYRIIASKTKLLGRWQPPARVDVAS